MLLSWSTATDNVTPSTNIVYLVYQSTTPGGEVYAVPSYTTAPNAPSYQVDGLTPGSTYYFVVRARDAAGNIDGNTVELLKVYPGLYVDALTGSDTSGDGTQTNPFMTITQALSITNGNEGLFVSAGTYSSAGAGPGETFPLELKPGTVLACLGTNHATVIDASASSDAIHGNTSAVIDSCKILPGSDATAINDQATPITINNVVIDAGAIAWEAVILSADSTITNSTFLETYSTFITVNSGNPTIKNNTLSGTSNSEDGILVKAGNPTIQGNAITRNVSFGEFVGSAIHIITGSATIDGNTIGWGISAGSAGINISGGSPVITRNTITNNNWGIYLGVCRT
jgi:parallel beta-helix repeat protein